MLNMGKFPSGSSLKGILSSDQDIAPYPLQHRHSVINQLMYTPSTSQGPGLLLGASCVEGQVEGQAGTGRYG